MDTTMHEKWLSPRKVQDQYGFSTSTLAKWRMDNINIPFSRMGKYIRYKTTDIDQWIENNKVEVAS
ncbi:MAG: hypothetical protein P794_01520 [Epsilonproteobacteria bacterium (ex Lamellibrachia satsuma)]|nr:MAG: hypothetical protein P794_01520 [Epsilonproteobacteria bacterium (ex Lamellibrachia satsuma)]